MRVAFLRPLKRAPTKVQAVVLHGAFQGYLPPGRRQDKRHRDVRASERSLEGPMQWRGRVKNSEAPGREQNVGNAGSAVSPQAKNR